MELKLSNVITSFIIFSIMVALFSQFYAGVKSEYGIEDTQTIGGQTIIQQLEDVQVVNGIDDIITAIPKISSPTASIFDILGGLTAAGIGFIKLATGVISFPIEIIGIITGFYYVPSEVATGLGIIFIIYLLFVLIKNYTKENN